MTCRNKNASHAHRQAMPAGWRRTSDSRENGGRCGKSSRWAAWEGFSVVPAEEAHLLRVARNLRASDRRELAFFEQCSANPRPAGAVVADSYSRSLVRLALLRGETCLAIGGITPLPEPGWGCPWMVGTAELDAAPRAFIYLARVFLPKVRAVFPNLMNMTLARGGAQGRAALAWLERCGFTLRRPEADLRQGSFVPDGDGGGAKLFSGSEVWLFYSLEPFAVM